MALPSCKYIEEVRSGDEVGRSYNLPFSYKKQDRDDSFVPLMGSFAIRPVATLFNISSLWHEHSLTAF